MFGDAGHGTIMFLFALALIIFEKRLAKFSGGGEVGLSIQCVCVCVCIACCPNHISSVPFLSLFRCSVPYSRVAISLY